MTLYTKVEDGEYERASLADILEVVFEKEFGLLTVHDNDGIVDLANEALIDEVKPRGGHLHIYVSHNDEGDN